MNHIKKEKVRCTIYLDPELWDVVKRESEYQKRPFSSQCELMVEDSAQKTIKDFKRKLEAAIKKNKL